jgi:hypothetical protein
MIEGMCSIDRRFAGCLGIFIALSATAASGGTLRIDLPQLVGDCCSAGQLPPEAEVPTPFDIRGVSSIRLVLEGTLTSGKGRGEGVEGVATEFELKGTASAYFYALQGFPPRPPLDPDYLFVSFFFKTEAEPQAGQFHIDHFFIGPFFDARTLDLVPVLSLHFSAGPEISAATLFPPPIPFFHTELLYETITPIHMSISSAYFVLEGASVTPEPGGIALGLSAALGSVLLSRARNDFVVRQSIARSSVLSATSSN